MRIPLRLLLLLLPAAACNKPLWHPPLPVLSQAPLPLDRPLSWGIYATLLGEVAGPVEKLPPGLHVDLADSTLTDGSMWTFQLSGRGFIDGRWPESVQLGFSAAFADLWHRSRRPHPLPPSKLAGLPVHFGGPPPATWPTHTPPHQGLLNFVSFSPIGFNGDSTCAVVYMESLTAGTIYLFRRSATTAWTLWARDGLWVS